MSRLAVDAHVHSEWSWDYASDPSSPGAMVSICEKAVRIGLPAIVFTEHLDFERSWRVDDGDIGENAQKYVDDTGHVQIPPFDADGYLEAIDRCRHSYPELRILTGVEFGQPHLWDADAAALLSSGAIDRVNGSLHMLPFEGDDRSEPTTLYRHRPADEVMWAYLAEIPRMVSGSDSFEVFTHIDYAVRSWPTATAGPFDPRRFEEGFRAGMRSIADSGRALEMNTRRLWPWIPQWGGQKRAAAPCRSEATPTDPTHSRRTFPRRCSWSNRSVSNKGRDPKTSGLGRQAAQFPPRAYSMRKTRVRQRFPSSLASRSPGEPKGSSETM